MIRQSVEVWVYAPIKQAFLILRVENETDAFWQPITGGIEAGERPIEAALREIQEETSLTLAAEHLTFLGKQRVDIDEELTIAKTVYLAETKATAVRIAPDEHVAYEWVSALETLPERLQWPNNRESLRWALAKIQ